MSNDLRAVCPCGHEASWHARKGGTGYGQGCQSRLGKSRDCYGICTCPTSRSEVQS